MEVSDLEIKNEMLRSIKFYNRLGKITPELVKLVKKFNACPHVSLSVQQYLSKYNINIMLYPPYCPNLAPFLCVSNDEREVQ